MRRRYAPSRLSPVSDVPGEDVTQDHTAHLSILVPAKDEAESLPQLVHEVRAALDTSHQAGSGITSWELILIDDGSSDNSWPVMKQLSVEDARVRPIRLRRNFGKSAALAAGLAEASGTVIATMDGDLQDDPAELPAMVALLDGPADLVAGYKQDRKDPLSKRLPSKVFNRVTGLVTGLDLRDHNCGLKVARREVFESVPLYGEMHRFFAAISHAQGFRVVEQTVNHRPRVHGASKFGLERYARGGLDLLTVVTLTRYNRRPAHLFGGIGLIFGVVGAAILVYLAGAWLFADMSIGNRPLLLFGVLLVLLAFQLASLGLLAELLVSQQASQEDPQRHVIDRSFASGDPEVGDTPHYSISTEGCRTESPRR
jgi:glycosyltransferase involved in cell wall biosynthesis